MREERKEKGKKSNFLNSQFLYWLLLRSLLVDQIVMRRYEIYIFELRSKANLKNTGIILAAVLFTQPKGLNHAICYMYIIKKIKPVFASFEI